MGLLSETECVCEFLEIIQFLLEMLTLGRHSVDFDLGGRFTGLVGVESSLLHHDELLLEVFFELSEIVLGLVGLSLDLD